MDGTCVIGIDGGGTRSGGVAMDREGLVFAEAEGGALNFYTTSNAEFAANLNELLAKLRRALGVRPCVGTVIGTAALFGEATDEEQREALSAVNTNGLGNVLLVGDAVTAAYGATGGRPGILIIAGTGSIAIRWDGREVAFSGGLGPMIDGDPGSASWMVAQALIRVQREACERRADSRLTEALFDYFCVHSLDSLISKIYRSDSPRQHMAAGAEILASTFGEVDQCQWSEIERHAGQALADLVTPLLVGLDPKPTDLFISGSVLGKNPRVREGLMAGLQGRVGSSLNLQGPQYDAIRGAALMARSKWMAIR